jgi:hypothetical protein
MAQLEPFVGWLTGQSSFGPPPAPPVVPVVPMPVVVELVGPDVVELLEDPVVMPPEPPAFPEPSVATEPPQPGTIAPAIVATVIKKGGRSGRLLDVFRAAMTFAFSNPHASVSRANQSPLSTLASRGGGGFDASIAIGPSGHVSHRHVPPSLESRCHVPRHE